jgi:hypothetical protein
MRQDIICLFNTREILQLLPDFTGKNHPHVVQAANSHPGQDLAPF